MFCVCESVSVDMKRNVMCREEREREREERRVTDSLAVDGWLVQTRR